MSIYLRVIRIFDVRYLWIIDDTQYFIFLNYIDRLSFLSTIIIFHLLKLLAYVDPIT